MFWFKSAINNHPYGYGASLLPSIFYPTDWDYSLLHVCFKSDTLVHFNNNVSVFWTQDPWVIIFAFLLKDLLRYLRSRQLFGNLYFFHFSKMKVESWTENCQKIFFFFFFLIKKIKNWIENYTKSIFIFLKLLKIEQKWNRCFRTRMHR